ncbi:hypothetical protein [Psychrobacter maritimus]|uniref:hypothetical protein n=1 Tax=Psychrobacter maritimus TaxID=256325 RepID=UPI003FD27F56
MVIRVLFNDKQLKKAAIDGCLFYWEYMGGIPLGVVWLVDNSLVGNSFVGNSFVGNKEL